ncbi:hypothetical protein [Helicobacter sp. MIT 05-5294]|uniref:hypothetical protein n=1 Tax=Helicobacter sp. MIT 05-5294 TaxID=1548150 RepID=UPI00051FA146|nr:hypothetical protein [Helicobacter sp. MIT 05-5294]TLD85797.1 hypothetical protein LS69_007835 [Helicobacter sp. MIT 05-5294]
MNKITNSELKSLQEKGLFKFRDALPTLTPNNATIPAGALAFITREAVEAITKERSGDRALGGSKKFLNWEQEAAFIPFVERTGQVTPYSDKGNPLLSGLNAQFNQFNHYRFTAKYFVGKTESEQYNAANIDYVGVVQSAATEAIAIELNRVAFEGYIDNSSNTYVCYGLLNNPSLENYKAAPKTFAAATWEEVLQIFAEAIAKLTSRTGNNINGDSKIRCVISASAYAVLKSKFTQLGISLSKALEEAYPGLYFVSSAELDNANANANVMYLIGESNAGGIPESTLLGYSEIAYMGNVVQTDYGYSQAVSAGTIGAVVLKNSFIVRYTGV